MGESITGLVRAIILVMVAVASLVMFLNLAFFFPWYLTLVEKGFVVSQMIATDNCLKRDYYDSLLAEIQAYPIFRDINPNRITIVATHLDEYGTPLLPVAAHPSAIQDDDGRYLEDYYDIATCTCDIEGYNLIHCPHRPYVQMGGRVKITVSADYRLQMRLFGQDIHSFTGLNFPDIPMSFTINTTTTKHYKDLYYEYIDTGLTADDYEGW
jgi:hypothetical protein